MHRKSSFPKSVSTTFVAHGSFTTNNAGSFRKKKGRISPSQKSPSQHVLSFLVLSFDFLHFIHGSTIGFSVKNERLITVKKKVNFSCISTSSAVSAAPYIFWGKVGKNLKGVMIVVVRSYWQDCTSPKIKSVGGFFNFSIEMKRVFLGK